jgi:hypothetical protein
MDKIKHDIRESSPVEVLIGSPPRSIVRWGISAIALVFVLSLGASWIISYPYIISGKIVMSTLNPPASMMAHTSGQIKSLFVVEGQAVVRDEYLALIETSAEIESVIWLSEMLENSQPSNNGNTGETPAVIIPVELNLGELRANYSSYKTSLDNYYNHIEVDYYGKKIDAVLSEIQSIDEYISQLEKKENLFVQKLKLVETQYLRDSTLFAQEVNSLQQLEDTQRTFFNEKIELEQVRLDRRSKEIDRASRVQSLEDYRASREDEQRKLQTKLENERLKLQGELEVWYLKHLIKSPIAGHITFSKFWGQNQVVEEGDIVMTVIPEGDNRIIGRIELSMRRSGEVEINQKVLIKLEGYPYLEYGVVEGLVESVSQLATNDLYIVDVSLPDDLKTNYNEDLQFNQNMSGTAEIVTEDMRLIERVIDPVRFFIVKNRLLKDN